jgi:hypothetical protein
VTFEMLLILTDRAMHGGGVQGNSMMSSLGFCNMLSPW